MSEPNQDNTHQTAEATETFRIIFDPSGIELSLQSEQVELVPLPREEVSTRRHSSPHGLAYDGATAADVNGNFGPVARPPPNPTGMAIINPMVNQAASMPMNLSASAPAIPMMTPSTNHIDGAALPNPDNAAPGNYNDGALLNPDDAPPQDTQQGSALLEALRMSDARFLADYTHFDPHVQLTVDQMMRDFSRSTLRLLHTGTPPQGHPEQEWGQNFTPTDTRFYFNILRSVAELLSELYNTLRHSVQNDTFIVRQSIFDLVTQVKLLLSQMEAPRPNTSIPMREARPNAAAEGNDPPLAGDNGNVGADGNAHRSPSCRMGRSWTDASPCPRGRSPSSANDHPTRS